MCIEGSAFDEDEETVEHETVDLHDMSWAYNTAGTMAILASNVQIHTFASMYFFHLVKCLCYVLMLVVVLCTSSIPPG